MLQPDKDCRDFIKGFEKLSLVPYKCQAGRWTNGYGHTVGVTANTPPLTVEEAERQFDMDVATWAAGLNRLLGDAPTTQHQFNAFMELSFNIGLGQDGFAGSSALRFHKAGNYEAAAKAIGLWNKFLNPETGKLEVSAGLVRRRAAETLVYLTPEDAPHPLPVPTPIPLEEQVQLVAKPKSAASSKTVVASTVAAAATVTSVAGSITDAVTQVTPIVTTTRDVVVAVHPYQDLIWKWGPIAFGVLGLVCIAFVLGRYVFKIGRGDVVST